MEKKKEKKKKERGRPSVVALLWKMYCTWTWTLGIMMD